MISNRELFLRHLGQTSLHSLKIEISDAEGIYLHGVDGKKYIDLVSGVSVSNLGHKHPAIIKAIQDQSEKYMHLMVYGEYIQSPQVQYAGLLTNSLPEKYDNVYFVNSGSEAIEGALKLAKKYTGRPELISCFNAYHGSTQGALSILGSEKLKTGFRPLLPATRRIRFNNMDDLEQISKNTAAVIVEPIQAEAGIILPKKGYLEALREKCTREGALLIFDEIQTGFGRTGTLYALQGFDVYPDIFTTAKAMGGGMPLGAFISSKEIMSTLSKDPGLGHITTFGGHPVCCAAGHAALQTLQNEGIIDQVEEKGQWFRNLLRHDTIKEIRGKGLFLAVEFHNKEMMPRFFDKCIEMGIIFDLFLFCSDAFRIAPPLIISKTEIEETCDLLLKAMDMSK